jgi:hypothetical protein
MRAHLAALAAVILLAGPAFGQSEAELAKKLSNPVAALISVPIQANYDQNYGLKEDGSVWRINIQPVIPISLTENWNVVSRTILPIVSQQDIPVAGVGESGIGDVVQSLFFSPKKPTSGGLIWGVGPVFLLKTASDPALGAEKWGFGPTAVALKQAGPWTLGALVNHIHSVVGRDARTDVRATFLQPFVSYITKTKTTIGLSTETTYDWEGEQWTVPVNLTVDQLLKVGSRIIQLGVGLRYWADSPTGGPQDLGGRLQLTFLFPK